MTVSEPERGQQPNRARSKLDERQMPAEQPGQKERPRGEREWHNLVERRIQEAMADGVFDYNLIVPISGCQRVRLRLAASYIG
jgi:hypothetical protein